MCCLGGPLSCEVLWETLVVLLMTCTVSELNASSNVYVSLVIVPMHQRYFLKDLSTSGVTGLLWVSVLCQYSPSGLGSPGEAGCQQTPSRDKNA